MAGTKTNQLGLFAWTLLRHAVTVGIVNSFRLYIYGIHGMCDESSAYSNVACTLLVHVIAAAPYLVAAAYGID